MSPRSQKSERTPEDRGNVWGGYETNPRQLDKVKEQVAELPEGSVPIKELLAIVSDIITHDTAEPAPLVDMLRFVETHFMGGEHITVAQLNESTTIPTKDVQEFFQGAGKALATLEERYRSDP